MGTLRSVYCSHPRSPRSESACRGQSFVLPEGDAPRDSVVAESDELAASAARDVRVIAFYLPQYHPIPENDAWWGDGFTEWTNVRKAKPNFSGHYQPHVPGEFGYYDLRDPAVRSRQAALAREYGIHGFCYYYYWFNGKRLLERPLDDLLTSGEPDFPFCVCWANENWTRRWDGRDEDILIAQRYSNDDNRAFIRSLFPLFRDARYIRVDGRPLLIIYKASLIPDLAGTAAMWRDECRRAGIGEIYLVSALTSGYHDAAAAGFDALVEFPPHGHTSERVNERVDITNPAFDGMIFGLRSYVAQMMTMPRPENKIFRCLIPSWDNTARQQDRGTAFVGSSPELFAYWLEYAIRQTRIRYRGDERLVFVNAWNEWGEGCHLEPDQRYGRAYLEAVRDALAAVPPPSHERPDWRAVQVEQAATNAIASPRIMRSRASGAASVPRVSVVMPAYNHQGFIGAALDSVRDQSFSDLEIIVVDDGSTDRTGEILDAYAAANTRTAITVAHQMNRGAHAAINHALTLATGEFVAIINSDDRYAPTRLERLLAAMDRDRSAFAFSGTRFIDDQGVEIDTNNSYVEQLRREISRCSPLADPLPTLLRSNVAISTGNFMFRRELLERIGGFSALRVCHDWDFILAATYFTPLTFVDEPLYEYRIHDANTFAGLRLLGHMEVDQVLLRFFARVAEHPALATPSGRKEFLAEVQRLGMNGYLPTAPSDARLGAFNHG